MLASLALLGVLLACIAAEDDYYRILNVPNSATDADVSQCRGCSPLTP
jgi:hypothetical protein